MLLSSFYYFVIFSPLIMLFWPVFFLDSTPIFLSPIILITLPYYYLNFKLNQNPFALLETNHFRVKHFSQFSLQFPPPDSSTLSFIKSNLFWIIKAQFKNLLLHLKHLVSFPWLGFLILPLLICSKKFFQKHWPLLIYSSLSFLLISLTWSIFPEPERMLLIPFTFLLLFSLKGLSKLPRLLQITIVSITLIIYSAFNFHRLTWAKTDPPNHLFSYNQQLINWINQNTLVTDTIAYIDPWTINLATKRPSIILPLNLNQKNLYQFINQYQPNYLITKFNSPLHPLLPPPVFTTNPPDYSIHQISF